MALPRAFWRKPAWSAKDFSGGGSSIRTRAPCLATAGATQEWSDAGAKGARIAHRPGDNAVRGWAASPHEGEATGRPCSGGGGTGRLQTRAEARVEERG